LATIKPETMLLKLFLAFTLIPITEIYLLIKVGSQIGAVKTILIVIATGFSGAYLARLQGLQTMLRLQKSMHEGRLPTEELLDAALIFIAGVVLLTPGFITDAVGLFLLIPETRKLAKQFIRRRLELWKENQSIYTDRYP
jgi:UPF0716 protein FxsA